MWFPPKHRVDLLVLCAYQQISPLFKKHFAQLRKFCDCRHPFEILPIPYPIIPWVAPRPEHKPVTFKIEDSEFILSLFPRLSPLPFTYSLSFVPLPPSSFLSISSHPCFPVSTSHTHPHTQVWVLNLLLTSWYLVSSETGMKSCK